MQLLPRVIFGVAAVGLSCYATPSAEASDRAAVLVCDVIDPDGPRARALDVGRAGDDNNGISDLDNFEDIDDRSCAEVLAKLADDGFEFEKFLDIESDADTVAIFALDRDDRDNDDD
jgi:hypothetical protein